MKLVINGKFLCQKKTGVQNFALGIVKELLKIHPEIEILTPGSHNYEGIKTTTVGIFKGVLWEQISLPLYLLKNKNPLLINLCNTAPLLYSNNIITIHDLAFEQPDQKWFKKNFTNWYKFLIPRIALKAKLILTVSDFSKNELVKHYHLEDRKIRVIPNGSQEMSLTAGEKPDFKYVLLVSSNNPRKNAGWVIKNIELLTKNGYKLLMIDNPENSYNNAGYSSTQSLIKYNYVSDSEYYSLLKNASALIYPSLYEGFGIPILESLSVGIPVVASNLAVFKESFNELPLYFELNDPGSFEKAIEAIKKKVITENDIKQLKAKFNFANSAKELLSFITELK